MNLLTALLLLFALAMPSGLSAQSFTSGETDCSRSAATGTYLHCQSKVAHS